MFQEEYKAQVKQACDTYDAKELEQTEVKKKLLDNLTKIQKDQIAAKQFQRTVKSETGIMEDAIVFGELKDE